MSSFFSNSVVKKNKPEQNGIHIPFCPGLSRIADSSCPSNHPKLFNYYFSTTLFNNNAFTVFSIESCYHFFYCEDIKPVSTTLYRKSWQSVNPDFVSYTNIVDFCSYFITTSQYYTPLFTQTVNFLHILIIILLVF